MKNSPSIIRSFIICTLSIVLFLICLMQSAVAQNVGINNTGATPNINAILDVDASTNDKGILIPRITTAQRTGIVGLGAGDEGLNRL